MSALDTLSRRLLFRRLGAIEKDALILLEDGRAHRFGRAHVPPELVATVEVHDARFFSRVVTGGSIGAAEAFMDGWWTCDDLVALLRIVQRAGALKSGLERGLARLAAPLRRAAHAARRNTRAGSRRNIRDHYDLGNDFFALWLDATMTYSSGVYPHAEASLEDATHEKLERICRRLGLASDHHVLEIGTGWGSFALHAARHHGCRVTTTTISERQHALALHLVEKAGLGDRIEVLLRDYRDVAGRYDRVVAIEMIEAVGHDHHDVFLRRCEELLKPDGELFLQAITMSDRNYRRAVGTVDFIKRHVFPGSCLPSVTRLCEVATRATDLRLTQLEDITPHYVRTLADWRVRFHAQRTAARELGYPDRLLRMWDFYLAYCEAGFAERHIGTVQAVFARAESRRAAPPVVLPAVAQVEAQR